MSALENFAETLEPAILLEGVLPDADDHKFLELAIEGRLDFLITDNTAHFPFKTYRNIQIVTPTEYWENYRPL